MNLWCRPAKQSPAERPAMVLLASPSVSEEEILALGAGSEEEGIPLVWERLEGDAASLAREAAGRSRLEVGVGLDGAAGAVTLAKFPEERGVYLREEGPDLPLRWIGQAAACLVKGEPLPRKRKGPEEEPRWEKTQGFPSPSPPEEPAGDEAMLTRITRLVMEGLEQERRR
ncbi:MAG: glycerol dehydratase reactivase beta/small subunit family protein [Synergistales bacterium]|nr:glycerol dehydratase reactivase beta/small subunit family protein [Synergistales bacterium]